MAKQKKKSTTKKKTKSTQAKRSKKSNKASLIIYEVQLVLLIALTIIFILSLHTDSMGIVGRYISIVFKGIFSTASYILPYLLFGIVFVNINKNFQKPKMRILVGILLFFIFTNLLVTMFDFELIMNTFESNNIRLLSIEGIQYSFDSGLNANGGGVFGNLITFFVHTLFGKIGIYIAIISSFIISVILVTNITLKSVLAYFGRLKTKKKIKETKNQLNDLNKKAKQKVKESTTNQSKGLANKNIEIFDFSKEEDSSDQEQTSTTDAKEKPDIKVGQDKTSDEKPKKIKDEDIDENSKKALEQEIESKSTLNFPNYKLPSLSLLNNAEKKKGEDHTKYRENANILMNTLKNFNVDGKIISITKGPTLTRYEFQPSPGIKVSKIVGLSDDIALKLAVPRVRIAPIPNKPAIGIEVPNKTTNLVNIRQVLNKNNFKNTDSKLHFALGKNISGNTIIGDLATMPHLLIAGATGSGKSVGINTIITSILFNATPDEVKFLMIDPKVVELSQYNGIPHLVLPVVTEPKKSAIALNWAVKEMENRYQKFAETNTRDLSSYNKKCDDEKLPQIVVIIDELSDLMMVAPKQVENSISRISQKARAAGIHLIVATQRPSVDVITGVIKANIPSRISFAVSSATDSRTILDMGGAEKLLGNGDMLYYPVGAAKPVRIQGAYISDEEVTRVTEYIKKQVDEEQLAYDEEILEEDQTIDLSHEEDEYLPEAIKLVVKSQKGSISMIQRKLRVGYNRAARMIDSMEKRNIVGPANGSQPREVLLTQEEFEELEKEDGN